jgi:hypothetical protein
MGNTTVLKKCMHCQKEIPLVVDGEKYSQWKKGEILIQDALPNLNPGERELLISGTCNDCWNTMFADLDEEL